MTSKQPLFEKDQLENNHKGVEDLIPSTVEEFLNYIPQMFEALQSAHQSGQQEELTRAAHSLKGAFANVCSKKLVETAYTIEKLCRQNQMDQAAQVIERLEAELELLQNELRDYQKELQSNG